MEQKNLLSHPESVIINDAELCKRLGIDRRTAANYRKKGVLPYIQHQPKGALFYNWNDVVEAFSRRTKNHL